MADLFKHVMGQAYDEKLKTGQVTTFLLSLFGKNPQELIISDTEYVDVDIIRDNRIVAADVLRGAGAGNRNIVGKFSGKDYKVPLFWEEAPITATMLNKRLPGVDPYSSTGKMTALTYWASMAQLDNTNKILRAMEKMAAEALQSGKVTLKNSDTLDFGKKTTHNLVPAIKWDNAGNPISDLEILADILFQDGKMSPNMLIYGSKAWDSFIGNSSVLSYLENRRIEPGRLAPGEIVNGAKPWGAFEVGPYRFLAYIYNEFYKVGKTAVPYVTEDTVIMCNKDARLTKAFGATEILPQFEDEYREQGLPNLPQFQPGQFQPFVYNLPPSALMAGVQSAPVVIPTAIDTIGTLSNVDS